MRIKGEHAFGSSWRSLLLKVRCTDHQQQPPQACYKGRPRPQPDSLNQNPWVRSSFFLPGDSGTTDKPCDKPCSLSCGSSPLFSLPGRHPREGLQSPFFYLCYFSCSPRLSLIFPHSPPLPLPNPFPAEISSLPSSITSSPWVNYSQHSPNPAFLLPQQKGESRGRLDNGCTLGGGLSSQLHSLQGMERGLERHRGAQAGKTTWGQPEASIHL